MSTEEKKFRPEDYSRFLIREFLKRNKFDKTYESFIQEDTREKVKMTKNELTKLLGIDVLMKRNTQEKKNFVTMMDILCDFLMISKEINNGVEYPTRKANATPKKDAAPKSTLPPAANSRAKTSGGPGSRPQLPSKPVPLKNAFCAGSNADISEANIDMNTGMLNKQSSKQNLQTKKTGFMNMESSTNITASEDIYGTSSKQFHQPINFTRGESSSNFGNENASYRESGISGSIQHTSNKFKDQPILLN